MDAAVFAKVAKVQSIVEELHGNWKLVRETHAATAGGWSTSEVTETFSYAGKGIIIGSEMVHSVTGFDVSGKCRAAFSVDGQDVPFIRGSHIGFSSFAKGIYYPLNFFSRYTTDQPYGYFFWPFITGYSMTAYWISETAIVSFMPTFRNYILVPEGV